MSSVADLTRRQLPVLRRLLANTLSVLPPGRMKCELLNCNSAFTGFIGCRRSRVRND